MVDTEHQPTQISYLIHTQIYNYLVVLVLIKDVGVQAVIIRHIILLGADQPGPEPVLHYEGEDDEDRALDEHEENVFAQEIPVQSVPY